MTSPICVMVVDDHTVVRSGLAALLLSHDDLELAAEAASGDEAVVRCAETEPDVVLMDIVMPGTDGIAATKAIRERWPSKQVVALTSFGEQEKVPAILQSGAIGYLLKNVSAEDLAGAIRAAYAGQPSLAPEATQALLKSSVQSPGPARNLTHLERQVLALMVKGRNYSEIADHLVVSRSTVKFHVRSLL